MIIFVRSRFTLSIGAVAALLGGCSESQPPSIAPGVVPQTSPLATQADRGESWLRLEAKTETLMYVSGGCGGICVFSYPAGKAVGSLHYAGSGLCSDKEGDVFVPSTIKYGKGVVYEFAHGGAAPIQVLDLGEDTALACSVDPKSGSLAVVSYTGVAIFRNASGSPNLYASDADTLYAGYDSSGNLFVDGLARSSMALQELRAGSGGLTTIAIKARITDPGQVQWDGKYITVEQLHHPALYRLQVAGSKAIVVGKTTLQDARNYASQSWIEGKTIIVPCQGPFAKRPNDVCSWEYPTGRSRKDVVKHVAQDTVRGVTISAYPR